MPARHASYSSASVGSRVTQRGAALLPRFAVAAPALPGLAVVREHVVGHVEVLVGRQSEDLLDGATSSSPSGLPCATSVSVYFGDGQPMWLRSTTSARPLRFGHALRGCRLRARRGRSPPRRARRRASRRPRSACATSSRVRELGRAVDRDVVVVVDVDEAPETEVPGERRRLVADAFLEVSRRQRSRTRGGR